MEKSPPSPKEFRPDLPKELANAILRCLKKTAGDRFKDYEELRKALAHAFPHGRELVPNDVVAVFKAFG